MLHAVPADRPVFGIRFSTLLLDAVAAALVDTPAPAGGGLGLVVTANVDHVVNLVGNAAFRAAYRDAALALIDGTPVLAYARLRGVPAVKVTGADLFPVMLARLRPGSHRPAFVCASQPTADALARDLRRRGFADPLVVVAPPAFETDAAFGERLVATLREARVTHLFFGLGAPKSEIWMHRNRARLPDCYGMGFGAALDFAAGTRRRAPRLFQRAGLEFLWRVGTEPRRLARRYFVNSWAFLRAMALDLAGRPLGE